MADRFVLARIVNMRGVDLTAFDFDYDLTWAAFFLNADGKIYGRYGGRDEGPADKGLSLKGLKFAMRAALQAYNVDPNAKPTPVAKPIRTVEQFPAAKRLKADACIHCHQVYGFRRERLMRAGQWTRDEVWVYPPPSNVGLTLDVDRGNRIQTVAADSAAQQAGLHAADVLQTLGGRPVASYGDLQYALHRGPKAGKMVVTWTRGGSAMRGELPLVEGWRESDISWRESMWGLEPRADVYGKDLSAGEKRRLGLGPRRLAFRQGNFVPRESRQAGIRGGDIILGIDGKDLEMTMLQFNAWVRLNYKNGDRVTFNVIRNGKRLEILMVLTSRIAR